MQGFISKCDLSLYFLIPSRVLTLDFQVFCHSTKRMEGKTPTGAILLAEYLRVEKLLSEINTTNTFQSIGIMVDTMIQQLEKYRSEAVAAEIIIVVTVLNPRFRLKFFELHYPEEASRAQNCIEDAFNKALATWPVTPPSSPGPPPSPSLIEVYDQLDVFTSTASFQTSDSVRAAKLDLYLQGNHPILPGQSELSWWGVSFVYSL